MTNKKSKKKRTKLKKTAAKKTKPVKKTVRRKLAKAKAVSKSKPLLTKAKVKAKAAPGKKTAGAKAAGAQGRRIRVGSQSPDTEAFPQAGLRLQSAGQSGDLQGLSNVEAADSESVEELIEEGNAFEANVVAGVERAEDADEKEVITQEVPEDDVPGEYLDKD